MWWKLDRNWHLAFNVLFIKKGKHTQLTQSKNEAEIFPHYLENNYCFQKGKNGSKIEKYLFFLCLKMIQILIFPFIILPKRCNFLIKLCSLELCLNGNANLRPHIRWTTWKGKSNVPSTFFGRTDCRLLCFRCSVSFFFVSSFSYNRSLNSQKIISHHRSIMLSNEGDLFFSTLDCIFFFSHLIVNVSHCRLIMI